MFGITKLDDLAQIFKKNGLKMLTRKEVQELYGDQIKQRTASTIDRKIQEGKREPRKIRKTKEPKIKPVKEPKVKVPKELKPKEPKKIYPSKIENQIRSVSVTENGQPVKNFLYNGEFLLKALKIAYRDNPEILDPILETGAVDIRFITPEVDKAFEFAIFAENLVPILLEEHEVYYESLTVGEFTFDHHIPERNLVIEVTNIPEFTDNLVDNQFFKRMNKSLSAQGIKLLRFGIDDVYHKTDLVISMTEHHLGLTKIKIPARKCKLVEISAKQAREFAEANHLNGHANAQVYYGLEFDGSLVQIITFAKHRYNRTDREIWEVIRACSKKHCLVQGGTQKIFKHFKNLHEGVELHTYCDMNISDGNSYALVGELIEETPGDLWYIIPDEYSPVGFTRVIRNRMMKIYLHRYFEGFPKRDEPGYKEINSVEFLRQRGIFAYYGSGNLVYKL